MKEKFLVVIFFCFLSFLCSSVVFALSGPHEVESPPEDGVCAVCHIPHKAEGIKIWARPLDSTGLGIFGGIRQLCFSCHDGSYPGADSGNDAYENLAGKGNVFKLEGTDHVMHGGAYIVAGDYPKAQSLRDEDGEYQNLPDWVPLDPNDWDEVPDVTKGSAHGRSNMNYQEGKPGFYCGSCHDPHENAGSAYLRYEDVTGDGIPDKGDDRPADDVTGDFGVRKTFCSQCHGIPHADDRDCMECHAPHRGATEMIQDKESIARWILLEAVDEVPFASIGAVFPDPEINKLPTNTPLEEKPSICYGCHRQGSAYGNAIATISADKYYHHPMGLFAEKGKSPRALNTTYAQRGEDYPGVGAWDRNSQLDCLSCHTYHKWNDYCIPEDNNSYLRWDFKNDKEDFCVECHNDKALDLLRSESKKGHRQEKNTSDTDREVFINDKWTPVASKNCMFCHYIHDGRKDGRHQYDWEGLGISIDSLAEEHNPDMHAELIPAELDALMRVPAKVLPGDWADGDRSEVPEYYEDMCYGCHGRENIVKGEGGNGSLLRPDKYFSHRYAVDPNDSKNPNSNMTPGGLFPVSDGEGIDVVDDYGVMNKNNHKEKEGYMYCGSCHNVHENTIEPYLNGNPQRHEPYKAYPDAVDGFCQGCHQGDNPAPGDENQNWIKKTHPVYEEPSDITEDPFYKTSKYICEGSGRKGAIFDNKDTTGTAPILCLSCHNVHAAMTNWEGSKAKKSWDNPSSDDESPGHGMLLVIDNNVDGGQKSDMCIQCHPM